MTSRRLRWGVLGGARIAQHAVLPALRASSLAEPAAIASRSSSRMAKIATAFDIPRLYSRYDDLLADPRVEAVYIPLPNALHFEWCRRSIAAGKAVLCEKPLVLSGQEARTLVDMAERAGVLLAEAFMYRHHPQMARADALVQGGAVGRLLAGRASLGFVLDDPEDIRRSTSLGGGAANDLGCYGLDSFSHFFDAAASGAEGVRIRGGSGVDELTAAVMTFPDQLGILDCSFRLPWLESVLELRGEEGTIRLPHAFNPGRASVSLQLARPDRGTEDIQLEPFDMYQAMVDRFSAAVLGYQPFPFDLLRSVRTAQSLELLRATTSR